MFIKDIAYFDFRNLEKNSLEFSSRINFIYGQNGQGKTSLLELIYFLSSGKSFRSNSIKELLQYNKKEFGIYSKYINDFMERKIAIKYNNKKDYYHNGKRINYDDYLGKLNVVFFVPEDLGLINDSPKIRRSFFDYEMSQSNIKYFLKLKEFNKVLKTRNLLLKKKDYNGEVFKIYNKKFFEYAIEIISDRLEYTKNISIILNLNYRKFFDDKAEVKISYSSFDDNLEKLKKDRLSSFLKNRMEEIFNKEKRYGYSLIGPQKDDFKILLNGQNSRYYSSQGEKKSIVFSLKIAELDMLYKLKNEYPILLIDDLFSYFDSDRRNNVLKYIMKKPIQIFITSNDLIDIEAKFFKIDRGKIIE